MFELILQITGVVFIGVAKAGFGGGIGIAAVPLFILSMPDPKQAIGMMLPILCLCDWFSVLHYRQNFDRKTVFHLYPGVLAGIILASICIYFLGNVSENYLKIMVGVLSFAFLAYQFTKTMILKRLEDYRPKPWHGYVFGGGIGLTSTLAHAAGPVATMYLLPQNMGKQLYVGTNVVLFTLVNISKLPFYFYLGMLDLSLLGESLKLLPFVPIGTLLGVWMNKHINEKVFNGIIYVFLFLLSVELTTGIKIFETLYSSLPFLPGVQ
ncbi:MAG: sulfite exporter TauE/SafE family protein [bacterium]|nr:sulfite exporter TauE/SafE family protein [bacterium]